MESIFETLASRANDCRQLARDIDLVRPVTYEANPPLEDLLELVNGLAAIYELRFAHFFDAYCKAVEGGFFHGEMEECIMQWWGACDDLRCAAEGAQKALLDTDGIDNVLLGVVSMAKVRSERFFAMLGEAKAAAPSGSA